MALADKDILITPNRGQSNDPKIEFKGADASSGPNTITLNVYPTDNGTLSFEGSAGQLFSITNSLTGTIFSVNDVSGIPSIEVLDTGLVKLAQYSGNVLLGTSADEGAKLHVNGGASMTAGWNRTATLRSAYPGLIFNSNDSKWASINYDYSSSFVIRVGATSSDTFANGVSALTLNATTGVANLIAGSTVGNNAIVTTGDTGTVTSTMIADGTIVNGDINASAAIAVSKLAANTISGITLGNDLNSVTFNNGGSGAASGTTYNGSTARTISYNTVGAASSGHGHYIGTTAVQSSSANQAITGITSITGGTGTTNISLLSANTTAAASGAITVSTGTTTTSGTTGSVSIASGNSSAGSGIISIESGVPAAGFASGNVTLRSGSSGGAGTGSDSGTLSLYTGTAAYNASSTARNSGAVNLYSGLSYNGSTGGITIRSGDTLQGGTSGNINIYAGDSNSASSSGQVQIVGGENSATGTGGAVLIAGGNSISSSSSATGGTISIVGGKTTSTAAITKTTGSVYIDGGGSGAGGTITYGTIYIGNQSNGTFVGTTRVIIGKSGTEVRLPGVGTTTGFVKIGANGTLSSDTNTYALSSHTHAASDITSGTIATARLGSGTANSTTYLRGDQTWATIVSGATLSDDTTTNSDGYYPGMSTTTSGAWTAATVSSTKFYFNPSTGQLNATNFNSLSDATKKENIKTIKSATGKTLSLRGVTFDWKDTKKGSLGVIAQEVEEIVPDAVSTSSSGEKSVNYGALVGLLIETIKEQNARIEKLEFIVNKSLKN